MLCVRIYCGTQHDRNDECDDERRREMLCVRGRPYVLYPQPLS
jgi:hypothetical protein